jgi:hypothetical protein
MMRIHEAWAVWTDALTTACCQLRANRRGLKIRDIVARKHYEAIQDYCLQRDALYRSPGELCYFRS